MGAPQREPPPIYSSTTSVRQPLGLLGEHREPRVDDLEAVGLVGLVVEVVAFVVPDAVVLVEAVPGLVPGPEGGLEEDVHHGHRGARGDV